MRGQKGREARQVVGGGNPKVFVCIGVVPVPSLRVNDLARTHPAIGCLLHACIAMEMVRSHPKQGGQEGYLYISASLRCSKIDVCIKSMSWHRFANNNALRPHPASTTRALN